MNYNYFNIYDDELLYSAIGRHVKIMGEISLRDVIVDIYGGIDAIPSYKFPANLERLVSRFPKGSPFTSDYFIQNHTLHPIYSPFIGEKTQDEVIHQLKYNDGKGVQHKLGVIAGGICRKRYLYYCQDCAKDELKKYDEAYFHRLHQVEGVFVCELHKTLLSPFITEPLTSRLEFITIEGDLEPIEQIPLSDFASDRLIWIAKQFRYILSRDLRYIDRDYLHRKYIYMLDNKGFCTIGGRIRQDDLAEQFESYYGKGFLNLCESDVIKEDDYNWLKIITRKSKRVSHPLRHVLLIGFLFGDFRELVELNIDSKHRKKIEWYPCLNPICPNYRRDSISAATIKYDYKSKKQIGTYVCECGFIYSRDINGNKYKAGRVVEFGKLWKNRLVTEALNGKNISEISRVLRCDKKTVIKYAVKLGVADNLNTKYKNKGLWDNGKINDVEKACTTRSTKERNAARINNHKKDRKTWEMKDKEILHELQGAYEVLNSNNRNHRISKTILASNTSKKSLIEKKLSKLPLCKEFLDKYVETLEEYQIYRVDKVCREIIDEEEELARWKIMRRAGLRESVSKKVLKRVNEWLKY